MPAPSFHPIVTIGVMNVRVWLRGGLGNQLFQYSAGLVAARALGSNLTLRTDLLPLVEDKHGLVSRWPEQISSFQHEGTLERQRAQPQNRTSSLSKLLTVRKRVLGLAPSASAAAGFFSEAEHVLSLFKSGNPRRPGTIDLDGYFLDARIPQAVEQELRIGLAAISRPSPVFLRLRDEVRSSLALHLRLGDHLALDPQLRGRLVVQLQRALALLDTNQSDTKIALFTDSPRQAMEILGEADVSIASEIDTAQLRPLEVLTLLGSTDGLIASASTFAWWAAFLQAAPSRCTFVDTQRFSAWQNLSQPGWSSIAAEH